MSETTNSGVVAEVDRTARTPSRAADVPAIPTRPRPASDDVAVATEDSNVAVTTEVTIDQNLLAQVEAGLASTGHGQEAAKENAEGDEKKPRVTVTTAQIVYAISTGSWLVGNPSAQLWLNNAVPTRGKSAEEVLKLLAHFGVQVVTD